MASQWPFKTIGPAIPSMYLDKRLEDDKEYGLNLFKPVMDICMKWLDTRNWLSCLYIIWKHGNHWRRANGGDNMGPKE